MTEDKEQAEECNHNWSHHYDFMMCSTCGEMQDIPTTTEYLETK